MPSSPLPLFNLPRADCEHILRIAKADLEALRGKRIFLTGGTGFFGKWLLGALVYADAELDLNLHLKVLSRDPASFLQKHPEVAAVPAIHFVQGDITTFSLSEEKYDYILHGATETTAVATRAEEERRSRGILVGMQRVLDLARVCGTRRLLHMSSGAIYGAFSGQLTGAREDEDVNAVPLMPYGVAKREAEKMCETSGIDFGTARAFAFLGPHLPLDAHFAAGNFLRDALRGGPVLVRGDGTALRSYLHPADLVIWLLRILLRGAWGRAYNVGSDEVVTTAQLARRMAGAFDPAPEVVVQSVQSQGTQNIYLPNVARARTELGLDATLPLGEAIARTISFLKT